MLSVIVMEGPVQGLRVYMLGANLSEVLKLLLLQHTPSIVSNMLFLDHIFPTPLFLLSYILAFLLVFVEHASQLLIIPHGRHCHFSFRIITKSWKNADVRVTYCGGHHWHDPWLVRVLRYVMRHLIVFHWRCLLLSL